MEPLLKVENLVKQYPVKTGVFGVKTEYLQAVNGASFEVYPGEVFGIVGESGCGKSTMGKMICGLIKPSAGAIHFEGEDVVSLSASQRLHKGVQMVFQDPYASLNPRMSVREIIAEPLIIHKLKQGREEINREVVRLLNQVGLDVYHAPRYPHEFSGGQRQRIGIARALAVAPKCIIADEPVSALDVSIQSQVINLLVDLKRELKLTYVFIAHDLSVVEYISDRIGVMYLGNFVEVANKKDICHNSLHPYTQALMSAVPIANPRLKKERIILQGSIPSALNPPDGCKFHSRCPKCMKICRHEAPKRIKVSENHEVYCHLVS